MGDRQRIIETNRSLRLIKNELEALLEKGVITDDAFDTIHSLLPAEAPLAGPGAHHTPVSRTASAAATSAPTSPGAAAAPPTTGFSNLSLHSGAQQHAAPPAYSRSTQSPAPPPGPPPPPAGKPVLAHARALYRYAAADARDCSFERDDRIAVHEYMNADWWMGRNLRTGQEGIFPRNYVELEAAPPPGPPPGHAAGYGGGDEKAAYSGYQAPGQPSYAGGGGYPPPPAGQQNPYNASVPPMAVAEQGAAPAGQPAEGSGKVGEYGKKFGKKLGNAAIFGAGATLGADIVNSIF